MPCPATRFLAKSLPIRAGEAFLDMGSGTGVVGIYAAERGATVTAVDISAKAVAETVANARLNGVRVRAIRGDLFARVRGRFTRVAFNAPYVRLTRAGQEDKRTCDRTRVSRLRTVTTFLRQLPTHLEDGGRGYLVLSSRSPVPLFEETADEAGLKWRTVRMWRTSEEQILLVCLRLARPRPYAAPSASRNGRSASKGRGAVP